MFHLTGRFFVVEFEYKTLKYFLLLQSLDLEL